MNLYVSAGCRLFPGAASKRSECFVRRTPALWRSIGGLALAAGLQVCGAQSAAPGLAGPAGGPAPGGAFSLPPSHASGRSPFASHCSGVPAASSAEDDFFSYTGAEASPRIVANPRNPLNLVGIWEQDKGAVWGSDGIGLAASFDGGLTWRRSFPPVTRCSGGTEDKVTAFERTRRSHVAFSPNGVAHYITHSINVYQPGDTQEAVLAGRSTDGGRSWAPPVPLLRGQGFDINDMARIAADPSDARYVYATWFGLEDVPGKALGPALLARSVDNGVTWESGPFIDLGYDLHTFDNELKVLPDGTVVFFAVGLDSLGNVSTYSTRSTDKGLTWSVPVKVADRLPVYSEVEPEDFANPAQDAISVAVDPRNGTLYAVWEDGRFSGMSRAGIALSQSIDGGRTWSEPVQVNRDTKVQAFVPNVHVRFDGQVAVTYYDLRSNTADPTTLMADLWLARSRDGLNWRESRVSGPFDMNKGPKWRGLLPTVGDQTGLSSVGPFFVPFYTRAAASSDPQNSTDILSQLVLGPGWGGAGSLAEAALNPGAWASRLDRQDEALPTYNVQGTRRPLSAVPELWRQRAAKAVQALLDRRLKEAGRLRKEQSQRTLKP